MTRSRALRLSKPRQLDVISLSLSLSLYLSLSRARERARALLLPRKRSDVGPSHRIGKSPGERACMRHLLGCILSKAHLNIVGVCVCVCV